MTDLTTRYLGLDLRSPIVASASPLNGHPDTARQVEDAGAAALVLPSLFEEEILAEELQLSGALEAGAEHHAEARGYFPTLNAFAGTGDRYLTTLERIKGRSAIPVIASLNATTASGGWVRYAELLQEAGADAVELNLYHLAVDPDRTAADMEAADLELVAEVRSRLEVPLAVKLSPFYSAMANVTRSVVGAGADGLVLFNRFYQPDLDLDTLDVVARVDLSEPAELRLPLRWIAILRPQLGPDVALGGIDGDPQRRRRGQGAPGRRRRGHDHLGPAAPRPGAPGRHRGGAARVAGGPRLRVGPPAAGKRQPRHRRRPRRLRAHQLHEDAALLDAPAMSDRPAPFELPAPRIEGAVTLRDGRRVGFAEYGPASGRPVLWFHGTPGGRRQVPPEVRIAATERGVRLVALERPGVGASTGHAYASILEWADDVEECLDLLGIDQVGLIGLSGGGPYVLACASRFPERVVAGAVIGSVAPSRGEDAAEGGPVALTARFNGVLGTFRTPLSVGLWAVVRLLGPVASQAFDLFAHFSPAGDRDVFASPGMKEMFTDDLVRASRRQFGAPILDLMLFGRDWGFSPRDVTVPMSFWHGDEDYIVPVGPRRAPGRPRPRRRVPGARRRRPPGQPGPRRGGPRRHPGPLARGHLVGGLSRRLSPRPTRCRHRNRGRTAHRGVRRSCRRASARRTAARRPHRGPP